jgi:hypothetical protein
MRFRSGSIKRKPDDAFNYASVVTRNITLPLPPRQNTEKLEALTIEITKVSTICEKIDKAIETAEDSPLISILTDICAAIRIVNTNHEGIVKDQLQYQPANSAESGIGMVSLGNVPKRNRTFVPNLEVIVPDSAGIRVPDPDVAPISPGFSDYRKKPTESVPPELIKFKEAVEKAESSTLIFNLDMGHVPILNTETMSNKATLALAAMAAENENSTVSVPTEDKIAGIDDILSVVKISNFSAGRQSCTITRKTRKVDLFALFPLNTSFRIKILELKLRRISGQHVGYIAPRPTHSHSHSQGMH